MVLSVQISWSNMVEQALQTISSSSSSDMTPLQDVLSIVEATLNVLADSVLQEQPAIRRKKLEHLVNIFSIYKYVTYLYFKEIHQSRVLKIVYAYLFIDLTYIFILTTKYKSL